MEILSLVFFQKCDVRLGASFVWQYIRVLAGQFVADKLGNSLSADRKTRVI